MNPEMMPNWPEAGGQFNKYYFPTSASLFPASLFYPSNFVFPVCVRGHLGRHIYQADPVLSGAIPAPSVERLTGPDRLRVTLCSPLEQKLGTGGR